MASTLTTPTLPAVAVVDGPLVERRRRLARPIRRIALILLGLLVGTGLGLHPHGLATVGLLLVPAAVAAVVAIRAAPWAAVRPPTPWYLGVEAGGLRLAWLLAPHGEVFLPWWAVGQVRVRRRAWVIPTLLVRLRPEGVGVLSGVDPQAIDEILRRGFTVVLHGTSMTARQAAAIIAAVRP